MVKITKVGEGPIESIKEYSCPRGCGDLQYKRAVNISFKKINMCKKCKGQMVTFDELQLIEEKRRAKKLKRNNLKELLSYGNQGNLDCPKCSRKMIELTMSYKRGRMMSRMEDMHTTSKTKMAGEMVLQNIPVIGMVVQALRMVGDMGGDLIEGKLDKSVTIDACSHCSLFWFDQGEINQVSGNDLTAETKNNSVKIAKSNSKLSPGVIITHNESSVDGIAYDENQA